MQLQIFIENLDDSNPRKNALKDEVIRIVGKIKRLK